MNGRLKQAVVGLVVVFSVSAVGASVTWSQMQGALRARRAVKSETAKTSTTQAKVAAAGTTRKPLTRTNPVASKAESFTVAAAESLSAAESNVLNRAARTHRIRLNNGTMSGAIEAVDASGAIRNLNDVKISFYQNGALVTQVTPEADGVFHATLSPGVYTFVAYGPSGYVCYGVQMVDPATQVRSAAFEKEKGELQNSLQVESLAVPPSDFHMVYKLARSVNANHGMVSGSVPGRGKSMTPSDPLPDASDENAPPQTNLKQHTVRLQADGSLLGKMTRIDKVTGSLLRVHSLNAYLIKNGAIVHRTGVAEDGSFKMSSVLPGTYSFVTAGAEGFSAYSVVVASATMTAKADAVVRPASFMQGDDSLSGTPGNPDDTNAATEGLAPPGDPNDPAAGAAPPPGGAGGGGAGTGGGGGGLGGGGAGGGGGLGGLIIGGLIGAGIGAAINNNDNNGPNSPAGP
jgi:hypothetical protein